MGDARALGTSVLKGSKPKPTQAEPVPKSKQQKRRKKQPVDAARDTNQHQPVAPGNTDNFLSDSDKAFKAADKDIKTIQSALDSLTAFISSRRKAWKGEGESTIERRRELFLFVNAGSSWLGDAVRGIGEVKEREGCEEMKAMLKALGAE